MTQQVETHIQIENNRTEVSEMYFRLEGIRDASGKKNGKVITVSHM